MHAYVHLPRCEKPAFLGLAVEAPDAAARIGEIAGLVASCSLLHVSSGTAPSTRVPGHLGASRACAAGPTGRVCLGRRPAPHIGRDRPGPC